MSQWKTDTDALIATIRDGNATDEITKTAVKELQAKLANNEGGDAAMKARVEELEAADNDIRTVITAIVTKLQEGDTEGALELAESVQPAPENTADNG